MVAAMELRSIDAGILGKAGQEASPFFGRQIIYLTVLQRRGRSVAPGGVVVVGRGAIGQRNNKRSQGGEPNEPTARN
jgi:hypothetical protein